MKKRKKRTAIPKVIEALVLFKAAHTCSICHNQLSKVQIHHIDGNPSNNNEKNLIVVCLIHHDSVSTKSTISKSHTPFELKKYKENWEEIVESRRKALKEDPPKSTLIRFYGEEIHTVYLVTGEGTLRDFQDPDTFEFFGFNWGNIDVLLDKDREKFKFDPPLTRIKDCKKIRLQYLNGDLANEVFLIWEDGRKHHIPDPETLKAIEGSEIEIVGHEFFNKIPHGQPLVSIFQVRTTEILNSAMRKHLIQEVHDCKVGKHTRIYNFVNLYGCAIGNFCIIGSFVEIQEGVTIGNNVKIESHSFICSGVTIEDRVFIGHHVVFTNDRYPRSTLQSGILKKSPDWKLEPTIVKKNASIGSNATILPGIVIGENAFIGAGSVVTKDVHDNTIVAGNPARVLRKITKKNASELSLLQKKK